MFYIIAEIIMLVIAAIPPTFRGFCEHGIARFTTPKGHVRFGNYHDTDAFRSLQREGYGVEPRWASDAVRSIENG